jgi:fibronectin type 3 domain-containing protein
MKKSLYFSIVCGIIATTALLLTMCGGDGTPPPPGEEGVTYDLGGGVTLTCVAPVDVTIDKSPDPSSYPDGWSKCPEVGLYGSLGAGQSAKITYNDPNGFDANDSIAFIGSGWLPTESSLGADGKSITAEVSQLNTVFGVGPFYTLSGTIDYMGSESIGPQSPIYIVAFDYPDDEYEYVSLPVTDNSGTFSFLLPQGHYGIFIMIDSNPNGEIDPGEVYQLYDGKSMSGMPDDIDLSDDKTDVVINLYDSYTWLGPPTSVDATDGDYTDHVGITWSSVSGAESYTLYRSDTQDGTYTIQEQDIIGTSTDDDTVTPGETFWYKVTSYSASFGESEKSDPNSGYALFALAEPTGLEASDGTYSDHIEVGWDAVIGADSYRLYRSDEQNGEYTIIESDISGTSTDDDAVTLGVTYWYKVTAYSISYDIESDPSSEDSGYAYGGALLEITGNVLDSSGFQGDRVYVFLYDDPADILNPLDQVEIPVISGAQLSAGDAPFTFSVAPGTYYLRAFRDAYGPDWSSPGDGLPTIGPDAQAPLSDAIYVSSGPENRDLTLYYTSSLDRYGAFNAYAYNESAKAEPPYYDLAGDEVWGYGWIGGYYLRMEASHFDNPSYTGTLSEPMVKVPTDVLEPAGTDPNDDIVALLDDGAASSDVGDNTNRSYDWMANDGMYSFGIPDPDSSHAGDYVFHFTNTDSALSYMHIEVDNVDPVVKLDRKIVLTYPTGAAAVKDLYPTLAWTEVSGAGSYQIGIGSLDGMYGVWDTTTENSYTVTSQLLDNKAYHVGLSAYDASDPGGDYDACTGGLYTGGFENYFIVDVGGEDTVTISGSITNNSGASGDYFIWGAGDAEEYWGTEASMVLDSSATSYSLEVFADPSLQGGVQFFIDVDGTGDSDTITNNSYSKNFWELDCSANVTVDFTFNPAIFLVSPENYARNTGNTPTFSWQDYTASAPSGDWCYLLVCLSGDEFPDIVWSVSNSITSFDLSSPPNDANDLLSLMGGASAPDLSSADYWFWEVLVVEYAYDDFVGLAELIDSENFYAESANFDLKTTS